MPKKGDINNPKGKGGFKDNPENRNPGGWSKETSIPYLQNKLGRMSLAEFEEYEPKTAFEVSAYNSVKEAWNNLGYLKEVTDRTSGKAEQSINHQNDGGKFDNAKNDLTKDQIDKLIDKL